MLRQEENRDGVWRFRGSGEKRNRLIPRYGTGDLAVERDDVADAVDRALVRRHVRKDKERDADEEDGEGPRVLQARSEESHEHRPF